MKKLQKSAASMLPDLAGLAGIGMMSYGAWLIARPAGYILFGAQLVALVVLYSRGSNND